jgi:hypothetical protein
LTGGSTPGDLQSRAPVGPGFKLRVYSRKWGHDDVYTVIRTPAGWHVQFIRIGGQCDPTGRPFLFQNLDHDEIRYPPDLGQRLHRLWREVPMMSEEEVQERLDAIANHLRSHEKAAGAPPRARSPKAQ